jgi:hypothetical protein
MTEHQDLLDMMEHALMRAIPHDDQKGRPLFHYTDGGGFEGILREKSLWATHFKHLNDRQELAAGEDLVEDEARKLSGELNPIQKWFVDNFVLNHEAKSLSQIGDVFVASLAENGDQLSQWRGYGARAAGYSLGFSAFSLPKVEDDPPDADLAIFFVKCIYNEDAFRGLVRGELTDIAAGFERFAAKHIKTEALAMALGDAFTLKAVTIALRRVASLVPRFKVKAFDEEHEWRLVGIPMHGKEQKVIRFRASHGAILPYLAIPLSEEAVPLALAKVVVGPTADPISGTNGARMLLKHYGYDGGLVETSSIPFRG